MSETQFSSRHTTLGVPIIVCEGEITESYYGDLQRFRDTLFDILAQNPVIALDWSKLTYIDSSGLGVLIKAKQRYHLAQIFILQGSHTRVTKLMQVTGLNKLFRCIAESDLDTYQPTPPAA